MSLLLLCLILILHFVLDYILFLYLLYRHMGRRVCFKLWDVFNKASHSRNNSFQTLNRFSLFFPSFLCFLHLSLRLPLVMSVNSSSSNASTPPSQPMFLHDFDMFSCFNLTIGRGNIIVYTAVNIIFLLPVFALVLHMEVRRWWQQQRRTMSHTDVLTLQIIVVELIGIFGATMISFASVTGMKAAMLPGSYSFVAYQFLIVFFHTLSCVEKYLAVVHPITYVGLKKEKGIRIRNACICCTWLLAFGEAGITIFLKRLLSICSTATITFNIAVISFCSLSVLCILYRPRPGTEEGSRQVDAFKLRAFYTIIVVLLALLFRYGLTFFSTVMYYYSEVDEYKVCVLWMSSFWFSLPSRLMTPLLFLHREGKLCCQNRRSRQWSLQNRSYICTWQLMYITLANYCFVICKLLH